MSMTLSPHTSESAIAAPATPTAPRGSPPVLLFIDWFLELYQVMLGGYS